MNNSSTNTDPTTAQKNMDLGIFENQIFFTTIRITIPGSETGSSSSIGTGFLFKVDLHQKGATGHFLISNKHVFGDPTKSIILNFHKHKYNKDLPDLGEISAVRIDNFREHYYEHPDPNIDLACINVSAFTGPGRGVYSRHLHGDFVKQFDLSRILPGTEVSFIGYPDNRFDVVHNLPILRKGHIATLPTINFNGFKQIVIDAQVHPGSSGSPVFVSIDGKFKLLGVVTQTMVKSTNFRATPADYTYTVQQTIGLGIVLKRELVMELLEVAKEGLSTKINRVKGQNVNPKAPPTHH